MTGGVAKPSDARDGNGEAEDNEKKQTWGPIPIVEVIVAGEHEKEERDEGEREQFADAGGDVASEQDIEPTVELIF